jgi:hypothetical protein
MGLGFLWETLRGLGLLLAKRAKAGNMPHNNILTAVSVILTPI